jgi:hemolysin activation/secretion protein
MNHLRWEKAMGSHPACGGPVSDSCSNSPPGRIQTFSSAELLPNDCLRRASIALFLLLIFLFSPTADSAARVFDPPKTGSLKSAPLNLRGGPSLSDPVVGRIEKKEAPVTVLEQRDKWVKIRSGDQEGWVFQALVVFEGEPQPSEKKPPPPAKPEAEPPEAPQKEPPAARVKPDQGEPVAVMIRSVTFSDNKVIDSETLQKAAADYVGRELTLEEMGELVDRITITYQEKGYILARAYLPKQDITDGTLQIAVMEGNIGKIEVGGKTHYDDDLVKGYFEGQLKEGVVKESALEKGLLLANELPDLNTNVVLRRGEEAGDVDVVVNTEDSSRMTLGLEVGFDYNNFGTELTSKNRYGTTIRVVDHNFGTITNIRGVMGDTIQDSGLGSVDFSVPVGSYGTRVSGSYLYGNYIVGQNFADLGLDGNTSIGGAKVSHPLILEKNQNLNFTFGWDHKKTTNFILDQERSIDELDVFYLTFSFDNLDRFLGKNIFTFGGFFGELDQDQRISPSRDNADRHYEYANASYARVQKLFGYTNLFFRIAGQATNDRLLPIEQFVIGGYGTVRGYEPSLYLGDSGYTYTAELMFAPPLLAEEAIFGYRVAQLFQLALFYDDGQVFISEPETGEVTPRHLTGWGGGFRFFFKDRFYFKYDVGFPIIRVPNSDKVYQYVQLGYQLF